MSLGYPFAVRLDRVAQQEMLRLDRALPDLDHERLLRGRLSQVVTQPLREPRPLPPKVRHGGDHRDRVPARRVSLRVKGDHLAGLHERLLGDRAAEELRDRAGDLVPRSPEPGILGEPGLGERRGGRLANVLPGPDAGLGVAFHQFLELEEEGGVLVPGEEPEEHPVGQLEGAARAWPLQLQQAPVVGDGADVLDPLGRARARGPGDCRPRYRHPSAS